MSKNNCLTPLRTCTEGTFTFWWFDEPAIQMGFRPDCALM